MKLQILAACAALVTLSAGSALAGDSITAKLASPVASFEGRKALDADKLASCNAKVIAKNGGTQLAKQ